VHSAVVRSKIYFVDDAMFQPVPKPGLHDWLANHKETGQTFHKFVTGDLCLPDSKRSTIYLLPVSFSTNDKLPADILELLLKFASSFFFMKVSVLDRADSSFGKIDQRINSYSGKLQVGAPQCFKFRPVFINAS
jgi:hypothetical protein